MDTATYVTHSQHLSIETKVKGTDGNPRCFTMSPVTRTQAIVAVAQYFPHIKDMTFIDINADDKNKVKTVEVLN